MTVEPQDGFDPASASRDPRSEALEDPGAVREVPGIGPAWRCHYCGAVVSASRTSPGRKVGLPRDVAFLVDRSASMRGGSLPQARRAVRMMLDSLGPEDGVQLFAFDHDRIPADGLGEAFLPRSPESIGRIDSFLAGLSARGGSELEEDDIRFEETREYVDDVLSKREEYREHYGDELGLD